ncbi:MAG: VIT domain-containing protein [Thermoguttaceae bacterium]|jgi:Ca-activated chloride channel family protein|nr:VIT domain-containing protein [Thermoguttaceae bacterium]
MIRSVTQLDDATLDGRTATQDSGFGALETERGRLPLTALDVRARISGLVADITVRQTFRNSLDVPLEATYIFPLPDRAAVTSFRMKVADRVVEGVLKERAEAREEYRRAIESGHRAAIAEEERSGTFNLRVGNIPPKETVSVELTLVGPVPFVGGEAEFRFPLVVAPRYVPGVPLDGPSVGPGWASDTAQVPDASRITPPVLLPGFPNPVNLSLEVELDPAGLDASQADWSKRIRASLHSVIAEGGPPWIVRLQPGERLNRDFILRFPLAAATVQTSLVLSPGADGQGGAFALTIVPPAPESLPPPGPRDIVFVLDRSGSMLGWKMVAARRAVGRMIDTLLEHDRFTVLAFDDHREYPSEANRKLVEATDRNRWQVLQWLGKIEARGGTEMGLALSDAAGLLAGNDARRQRVMVLVTDGQVGGEDMVLESFVQAAGRSMPRVHTVGIDEAVNAGFLRRLADQGDGLCELVESESQLDAAMDRIHRNTGQPVLTQLRLEPLEAAWDSDSLAPSRLPDVFAERPVTVFGRLPAGASSLRLRVCATEATGRPWQHEAIARATTNRALTSLWGRAKVRELEDLYASGLESDLERLAKRIVEVSVSAQVLSRFTAYVAVDRSAVVNPGGKPAEIVQPVEMPEGWEMGLDQAIMAGQAAGPMAPAMETPTLDFCIGDPEEYRYATRYCRSEPPKRPRRRQTGGDAPTSAESDDVVEIVRDALEEFISAVAFTVRRSRLEQLVTWLRILLCQYNDTETSKEEAIRKVIEQAETMLSAAEDGDKSALDDAKIRQLREAVEDVLRRLRPPPSPPRRERFWA